MGEREETVRRTVNRSPIDFITTARTSKVRHARTGMAVSAMKTKPRSAFHAVNHTPAWGKCPRARVGAAVSGHAFVPANNPPQPSATAIHHAHPPPRPNVNGAFTVCVETVVFSAWRCQRTSIESVDDRWSRSRPSCAPLTRLRGYWSLVLVCAILRARPPSLD